MNTPRYQNEDKVLWEITVRLINDEEIERF